MHKILFKEPQGLNHVADFHHLFDAPVLESPQIPSSERCALRVNLLQEELNELKEAIDSNDLVGIADALGDLQYVLSGAVLEFGMADKFAALFDEIQRSNMSKACNSLEEANRTVLFFETEKMTPCKIIPKDKLFLVHRSADNKILKSINYSEAKLGEILFQDPNILNN